MKLIRSFKLPPFEKILISGGLFLSRLHHLLTRRISFKLFNDTIIYLGLPMDRRFYI